jgi:hypothetical protein
MPQVLATASMMLKLRWGVMACKHSMINPKVNPYSKIKRYAFHFFFLGTSSHKIKAKIAYKKQCSYLSTLGVVLMLTIEFSMVG